MKNMIHFPSHKNNTLEIVQFNTFQKKFVFYGISVYRILIR